MQYKNVTAIIAEILKERDSIPLVIDKERYLPNPQPYIIGEALRGGLRKALRVIEQAPVVDAVHVVRCKKCENASLIFRNGEVFVYCKEWDDYVDQDGFCYRGGVTTNAEQC